MTGVHLLRVTMNNPLVDVDVGVKLGVGVGVLGWISPVEKQGSSSSYCRKERGRGRIGGEYTGWER